MKKLLRLIAALLALVILTVAGLILFLDADRFRPRVEALLTSALNRETHIGHLSIALLKGRIAADSLTIAEDPAWGKTPFVQAKELNLEVDLWPLVTERRLNITGINIASPVVRLTQNRRGQWNFASLGAAPAPAAPAPPPAAPSEPTELAVKLLEITGGKFSVDNLVLENTALTIRDFKPSAAFPFSLSTHLNTGGEIRLTGSAGPINTKDASNTPVSLAAAVTALNLAPWGFTGILGLDGKGATDGRKLDWSGQLSLRNAKFAAAGRPSPLPVELSFTVSHNLQRHFGAVSAGRMRAGKAAANITGSYAQNGSATSVNLHVAGAEMPVPDLLQLLPAFDIQLPAGSSLQGGTLSLDLNARGPAASPDISGTLGLEKTRLTGFDLGSKMAFLQKLAGIKPSPDTDIESLRTSLRADASGTAVETLELVVPAMGRLSGAGSISPTHILDFRMTAGVVSRGLLQAALKTKDTTEIPFFITGTSSQPEFKPDAAAIAAAQMEKLRGKKVGGIDAGKAVDTLKGLFGRRKPQR